MIYLDIDWTGTWDILDKTGTLIGLGTFIFSILIWVKVKQQERKLKRLSDSLRPVQNYSSFYDSFEQITTTNPAALCISLLPTTDSIKKAVTDFIKANNLSVNIIEEIKMDGINNKEDVEKYIHMLREKRRGPLSEATELRLFIAGPVQAGTIAGAVFDNWIPVLLYQKGKITYEYWGPLAKL